MAAAELEAEALEIAHGLAVVAVVVALMLEALVDRAHILPLGAVVVVGFQAEPLAALKAAASAEIPELERLQEAAAVELAALQTQVRALLLHKLTLNSEARAAAAVVQITQGPVLMVLPGLCPVVAAVVAVVALLRAAKAATAALVPADSGTPHDYIRTCS